MTSIITNNKFYDICFLYRIFFAFVKLLRPPVLTHTHTPSRTPWTSHQAYMPTSQRVTSGKTKLRFLRQEYNISVYSYCIKNWNVNFLTRKKNFIKFFTTQHCILMLFLKVFHALKINLRSTMKKKSRQFSSHMNMILQIWL